MVIASFKAWLATKNEQIAKESATYRHCCYGFCIHDGKFYVGEREELTRAGMLYIKEPTEWPELASA